ncbi:MULTISPECIES: transporter substrate-binding domain-containing protein [unclassified Brenneria]|uniref:transporter substrate-binding domain-containing protein n=1 Tax=unclassified Brenneria TaxID=2634434 RepID=UPI0015558D63|nr:transporter substrate-binding domain-containing protein [Brenneria sp. hezel4-2-4]MEE3649833.1 transporter substrate-binding domain-containing protein [Brenneria sp. HEZEL_4_2_4]NPC99792.1 transporter substrate-binding domain-containing protein [Brenneria sp. hezel4-2-4]
MKKTKLKTALIVFGMALMSQANADATLDRIQATKKVRIGVILNSPPLGYTDVNTHKPAGFEIVLANDIAKRLGAEAEIVQVNPANRVQFLQQGKVDALLANMQVTPEREKALDHAKTPYKYAYGSAMIKKGSGVTRWEDLRGKEVCLSQGSNYAKPLVEGYGIKTKGLAGSAESLLALKGGNCSASVHDGASLRYLLSTNPDWADYEVPIQQPLELSPGVIWVKKGQQDTATALDEIVNEWHRSGWLVNVAKENNWPYLTPELEKLHQEILNQPAA